MTTTWPPVTDKATARLLRSIPPERMIAHGTPAEDVLRFARALAAGAAWCSTLETIAAEGLARARERRQHGHRGSAAAELLGAAACWRTLTATFDVETGDKRRAHMAASRAFTEAMGLRERAGQRFDLHRACGWLLAGSVTGCTRVVMVIGGMTGWGESYELAARQFNDRGLDVALVDLPGQGDMRYAHGTSFESHEEQVAALADVATHLRDRGYERLGVWGSSAGAYWCALAGALLPDIAAICCVSASPRPVEYLRRFPSATQVVAALLGACPSQELREELLRTWMWPSWARVSPPALFLHGSRDPMYPVVSAAEMRRHGTDPRSRLEIIDGEGHGLYAVFGRRDRLIADWFAELL